MKNIKNIRPLLTVLYPTTLLACILAIPIPATGVEILVDAREIQQKISPEVFGTAVIYNGHAMGFNDWVSDQRDYEEARRDWNYYLPLVSELGPTVLRYPHGLGANNFHWKAGIGPIEERDPNYDGTGLPQTFGTDEFLQYCEELGARAILVVNVSVGGKRAGTVQNAADWVEYCNAPSDGSNPGGGTDWAAIRASNGHPEPYGVPYWELGNEETWPGWESYAQRVREYSAAMKTIDPTIKVGVIRTGAGLDPLNERSQWLDYHPFMLENAGEDFDFWIHHTYPPSSSGVVNGFEMLENGTSVTTDFRVGQSGTYRVRIPIEGFCWMGKCPTLDLTIDGKQQGTWFVQNILEALETTDFTLEAGQHQLKLEVNNLAYGNSITVCQQLLLLRQGEEEPGWIDLKNSMEFYHSYMGGWPVSEEALVISEPYAGGKPVFYTEANSQYNESRGPWHFSKASALREMLGVGCLYHVFLRHGIPLVNYWFLFEERNGVGILEGVAHDDAAHEAARLDPHRRPVFHLLKAYRQNAFDWLVSTDVLDSPRFVTGRQTGITLGYAQKDFEIPYVHAVATLSEAGDGLSVFVINLHPEEDIPALIEIAGFEQEPRCEVLTITGTSPGANNEPEDCPAGDCVTTIEKAMDLPGAGFAYSFPKHSVTVFVFDRVGSDHEPPGDPTGLTVSAGEGKAVLLWDANREQDLDGYFIYRSRSPEGPFRHRVNAVPMLANEYLDAGLGNNQTYTYAVRAVDRNGNESGFSNKVHVTLLGDGGDPSRPAVDQPPWGPAQAEASVRGSKAVHGSNILNSLACLSLPVGLALFLRSLARKRSSSEYLPES